MADERTDPRAGTSAGPWSFRPSRDGIAALLTLLLPGLGQAWLGAGRRGVLLALPLLTVIAAGVVLALVDPPALLGALVKPAVILGLLVVILGLAAWHVAAIEDTYRVALRRTRTSPQPTPSPTPLPTPRRATTRRPVRPRRSPLLAMALAAAIGVYGGVELLGIRALQTASVVFVEPSGDFEIPVPSFEPDETEPPASGRSTTAPSPTHGPSPTPGPAWARDGRLNLLLIGSDAGPGRWLARMDAVVVLSVDAASGRAALFSIPRYLGRIPLPPESADAFPDGIYPRRLTSLYVYAIGHPRYFPGTTDEARGYRAVTGAVQEIVGVPLDGVVAVNLNGFVDLVEAIGGLWIDIPTPVYDARYPMPDGSGTKEIYIRAGCRHLDGEEALEYARTRHQDSDYGRIIRQQRVLIALARQADPIALLPRAGELLDIAAENLWTTIDVNEVANLAVLAARIETGSVQTFTLGPPEFPELLTDAARRGIRKLVRTVFDAPPPGAPTARPEATPRPCPRS